MLHLLTVLHGIADVTNDIEMARVSIEDIGTLKWHKVTSCLFAQ